MTLAPGSRLGPYEILAPLGAGGMGQVYRARDTRLDRSVAIKVLSPSLAADAEFRERFDREARVISQLEHPHICPVYDVGTHDGTACLVMPCLEGTTLAARLERGGLSVNEAIAFAIQIGDALTRAHRAHKLFQTRTRARIPNTATVPASCGVKVDWAEGKPPQVIAEIRTSAPRRQTCRTTPLITISSPAMRSAAIEQKS